MKFRSFLAFVAALVLVGGVALAAAPAFDNTKPIAVVSREEGSGTRGAFIELAGIEKKDAAGKKIDHTSEDAIIANNTATVLTTVAGNEYAIGYISLSSLNDTVKALKVEDVEGNVENILADKYAVARPFNLVTKGGKLSPIAQDFVNYILSAEGQKVISDNKAIAVVKDAPKYESKKLEGKVVVGGSSSVSPVMEKLAEAYMALNKGITVELQTTDSTSGVKNALNGSYEIGMASRELKESETKDGAKSTVLAKDGIVVIVHPSNPIENITKEQLTKVFTGEIKAWSELAGK